MIDFAEARRMMVDGQVRTVDVTDQRILAAMLEIPREKFVPNDRAALAYLDRDVPVTAPGPAQRCLLKPMVLAKLVQAAEIGPQDLILDVGCASGYSAALLSRLGDSVVALEEDPDLVRAANETLDAVGATNVAVVAGPLPAGWPSEGPYDVIVVAGAIEVEPEALCAQLKHRGRLVCVRRSGAVSKAMLYRRDHEDVSGWPIFDAAAPLLPGFAKTPEFVF